MQNGRPQANTLQIAKIIWIAILFSVGLLWFLSTRMARPDSMPPAEDPLMTVLSAAALGAAAASFVLPNFLIRSQIRMGSRGQDPALVASRIFYVPFIVQLALRESIAVFGFQLVAIGYPPETFLYFGSPAAILILLAKPTGEKIKEIEHQLRMPSSTPG